MSKEAPLYLLYLGYLVLGNTVDRDLMDYRDLNSLPLNDAKSAIYKTESDSNRKKIDELRSEAEAAVKKIGDDLDSRYGATIDTMAQDFVTKLESGRREEQGPQGRDTSVAYIRDMLTGFQPSDVVVTESQLEPNPVADSSGWVAKEKESADAFGKASGTSSK
jgi:hypothetical protein